MGLRILSDGPAGEAVLYDSTTMTALGPVMPDAVWAEEFTGWLERRGAIGERDGRRLSDLWDRFASDNTLCEGCGSVAVPKSQPVCDDCGRAAAADDIAATFRVGGWKARVVEREGPDSPEPDRAYRVRLDYPDGLRTDWPIQYDNGTIGYDSEVPPAAQKATEEAFGWIAHWMDNRQLALFANIEKRGFETNLATKGKEPMSGKISDNARAEARNSAREIMRLAQYIQGTENVKYAKAISTHALDLESFLVMEAEISHDDGGYHRASRLIGNTTRPAVDR